MTDPVSDHLPSPPRRDRSFAGRRKAHAAKGARERRIVNLLNAGVSVAEIAQSEGVTHRRMRMTVGEILALAAAPGRVPGPSSQPPQRGAACLVRGDGRRQSRGGRSRGQNRPRARPLSRLRWRRAPGADGTGAPRDAGAAPSRARRARPEPGRKWRRKRLISLDSRKEMAPVSHLSAKRRSQAVFAPARTLRSAPGPARGHG
jgi:DNA-binding CsgD family transcriptional regulator